MKKNLIAALMFFAAIFTINAADNTDKLIWQSKDAGKNGAPNMTYWASKQFNGKKFVLAGQGKDGGAVNGIEIAADSKDESATLMVRLPATHGKTYIIKVRAKAENPNEDSKIRLFAVAQSPKRSIGSLPRQLTAPIYHKYAEYELVAKVPGGVIWDQTTKLQFSFSTKDLKGGKIFFDDIRIFERP